jgi:hypothetical protein
MTFPQSLQTPFQIASISSWTWNNDPTFWCFVFLSCRQIRGMQKKQSVYVTNITSQTTGVLLGIYCWWCCFCCCLFVSAGIAQSLSGYELDERGSIPRRCKRIFSTLKRLDRLCGILGCQWHCPWGSEGHLYMVMTMGVSEVDRTCAAHRCWTLYCPVVTICTTNLTFSNPAFCPHSVFMCFVWIWEKQRLFPYRALIYWFYSWDVECLLRGADWVFVCAINV